MQFFLSPSDAKPPLDLKSCNLLGILNINDVEIDKTNILKQCSDLFTGLGLVKGSYHITVAKNAVPAIHSPRKIPITTLTKLKSTLDCMEKATFISKISKPTPWVHSMVIVEKKRDP